MVSCLDLCRRFLPKNLGIYGKEFVNSGHRSLVLSNVDGLKFDVISPGHIDVVPSKTYEMKIDGGKIFGRGVFDMKSFVASSLINLWHVATQSGGNIRYAVVITSDEEIGGRDGMGHLVRDLGLETQLVLDSDSGKNIHNVVQENLGAITIKLHGEEDSINRTVRNIKNKFADNHCESYGSEVDVNFASDSIETDIGDCLEPAVTFDVLMLNDYRKHNIFNRPHCLYREISEKNGVVLEYVTSSGTNDSRYFFDCSETSIISHQASGGGNHQENEWLDVESLYRFNRIQREFLMALGGSHSLALF
jgi:acetylornithine deacetylase/succinyl-diaminopimelate desuccinylase-like protein